jgi:phosphate-selective porin
MKWRRWAIAAVAVFLLGMCKPAVIRTDRDTRLAVFFRFQSGDIRFVNSVTGQPVHIDFCIGRRFQAFSVRTDETTEDYYTNGTYDMNTIDRKSVV